MSSPSSPTSGDKSYLKQKKVMKFMDVIVGECLANQPEDPEEHILRFLASRKGYTLTPSSGSGGADANGASKPPIHPTPPQGETPAYQRQRSTDSDGVEGRYPGDLLLEYASSQLERMVKLIKDTEDMMFADQAVEEVPKAITHPLKSKMESQLKSVYQAIVRSKKLAGSIVAHDPQETEAVMAQVLYEAAEASLASVLDEASVIEKIVIACKRLLAADRCSVFIADEERKELRTVIDGKPFYLRYGQGIAGSVARTGCSLLIPNAYEDSRFDSRVDASLGFVTRDILCLPVSLDDKLIAVVQLVNKIDGTFTEADEALFASFAKFAAMRIVNANLFREQKRLAMRNSMMAEVMESLANTRLDESVLIPVIIKNAKAICGADRCSYFQVDDSSKKLTAHLEGVDDQIVLPLDSGIAGWCAQHKQILNITDPYTDPRFNKDVDQVSGYKTQNILCIPVVVDQKIVGVSQLVNKTVNLDDTDGDGIPLGGSAEEDSVGSMTTPRGSTHISPASQNERIVPFNAEDEEVLSAFASIAGVCIRNCRLVEASQQRQNVLESTLEVAKSMLHSDVTKPEQVMNTITLSAGKLSGASRCLLYMMDAEQQALCAPNPENEAEVITVPIGEGIIGRAAQLGTVNQENIGPSDSINMPNTPSPFGACEVRNVLAAPIVAERVTLGVVALVNKRTGEHFSDLDKEVVELFAVFAACVIRDAKLLAMAQAESETWASLMQVGQAKNQEEVLETLSKADDAIMSRQSTSNTNTTSSTADFAQAQASGAMNMEVSVMGRSTVMNNPMMPGIAGLGGGANKALGVSPETLEKFRKMKVDEEAANTLTEHSFDIHSFRDGIRDAEQLVPLLMRIFENLNLIDSCNLNPKTVLKFILAIRARYRNVPYHSFFHAFDVTQTIFELFSRAGIAEHFEPHEKLALVVAAIVHDVDHRGVNNNFHMKAETPMGILTSLTGQKAVLEVHHATIAVELLATLNVFVGLGQHNQTEVYKLLIDAVLATDMAAHKEHCDRFEATLASGADLSVAENRRTMIIMLLKAADISNITKDFDISRKWGISVMDEFYKQGDLERQSGVEVTPMFDRERRVELAKGQIGFIQFMGRPFFSIVAKCLPSLAFLVDQIDENIKRWELVLQSRSGSFSGR